MIHWLDACEDYLADDTRYMLTLKATGFTKLDERFIRRERARLH